MSIRRSLTTMPLSVTLFALSFCVVVRAESGGTEALSLRGLPGFRIVVEGMHPQTLAMGIDSTFLYGVVSQGMRELHIKELDEKNQMKTPRKPWLTVRFTGMPLDIAGDTVGYLYSAELRVHQLLFTSPGDGTEVPLPIGANTWSESYLGTLPPGDVRPILRETYRKWINQLAEDYRAANDDAKK